MNIRGRHVPHVPAGNFVRATGSPHLSTEESIVKRSVSDRRHRSSSRHHIFFGKKKKYCPPRALQTPWRRVRPSWRVGRVGVKLCVRQTQTATLPFIRALTESRYAKYPSLFDSIQDFRRRVPLVFRSGYRSSVGASVEPITVIAVQNRSFCGW